jgi:hypothetical protein
MPSLRIVLDGEGAFPELAQLHEQGLLIHLTDDADIAVTSLAGGMQSGDPSAAFVFRLPDGRAVFAETSLRLLLTAADALKSRHGDPRMADLSMPDITMPADFPPRAMIRAAQVSAEQAQDSVSGSVFDLLRRAINLLKRADGEQARVEAGNAA